MKHRLKRHLCLIAVWAMLLPFVGSSLIANGVMPVMSPNGTFMQVICTGEGMVEMAIDSATMQPVTDDGDTAPEKAEYCAWAAFHPLFALTDVTALLPPDWPLREADAVSGTTVLRFALATGLPPATGPPVTF